MPSGTGPLPLNLLNISPNEYPEASFASIRDCFHTFPLLRTRGTFDLSPILIWKVFGGGAKTGLYNNVTSPMTMKISCHARGFRGSAWMRLPRVCRLSTICWIVTFSSVDIREATSDAIPITWLNRASSGVAPGRGEIISMKEISRRSILFRRKLLYHSEPRGMLSWDPPRKDNRTWGRSHCLQAWVPTVASKLKEPALERNGAYH